MNIHGYKQQKKELISSRREIELTPKKFRGISQINEIFQINRQITWLSERIKEERETRLKKAKK